MTIPTGTAKPSMTMSRRRALTITSVVSLFGANAVAAGGLDGDRVEALDVRDGARCDVPNLSLEGGEPLFLRIVGADDVERKHDVGAGVAGALAHHELAHRGALAPVHVARVLAVAE